VKTTQAVLLPNVLKTTPVALSNAEKIKWSRRSPVRSELRSTMTIAIAPAADGIADSSPMVNSPAPDAFFQHLRQPKPIPYDVTGIVK
jgi:hypothetical protein